MTDWPTPTDDDRHRAKLLASAGFTPDVEEIFAQGIAVARTGGDVQAYLREAFGPRREARHDRRDHSDRGLHAPCHTPRSDSQSD